jgi:hypothetical protein
LAKDAGVDGVVGAGVVVLVEPPPEVPPEVLGARVEGAGVGVVGNVTVIVYGLPWASLC